MGCHVRSVVALSEVSIIPALKKRAANYLNCKEIQKIKRGEEEMKEEYERVNGLSEREIAIHLRKAKKSGYVCPKCGSGSREHGTGIKAREWKGNWRWKCFSCGEDYSNVDILSAEWKVEAAEVVKRLREGNTFSTFRDKNVKNKSDVREENPQRDYTEFYKNAEEKLGEEGGAIRSLPVEFLRLAKAGIATAEMLKEVGEVVPKGGKYLILPYNESHFFMRGLNNEVKRGNTGGRGREIYNPLNAFSSTLVFVVEGQIDCLSVMYATGKKVIAIGSAVNLPKLPERLAELNLSRKPKVIILADNDETGKKFAEKGMEKLRSEGYMATYFSFSNGTEKVDANSILQSENGKEKLAKKCKEFEKLAEQEFAEMPRIELQRAILEIGEGAPFEEYFAMEFEDEIEEMKKYLGRKTGYEELDNKQILFPGLYFVGGVPSIGKTTFMWQLLEQMARQGEICIYCSYEMSKLEMFSKSVSREIYKQNRTQVLSSAEIRRGSYNATSWEVVEEFKKLKELDLYVVQMADETIDEVLKKLRKVSEKASKPPVICLDYLQVMPSDKDNAKSAIDDTARKLKIFQRETGTTFFVVSSLNRQNYMSQISFESFKESGGIEFSADVVWGLQLYATKDLKDMSVQHNREKIDAAKKENPRKVHLKCLKNRNGGLYDCYFKYYPASDYFESVEDEEELTKSNRERV